MASLPFEKLRVYQLSEKLADEIWDLVLQWQPFAKFSVGKQLVSAVDSIGANIAEGVGRGAFQDNRRFVRIARGSFYETRHWLRRAFKRNLLDSSHVDQLKMLVEGLGPTLNAYLASIGKTKNSA